MRLSRSLKAALLSALIFPGSGHLLLKKYVHAALLAGVTVVCLYFLISNILEIAQVISDKILSGEIPADVISISESITIQLSSRNTQLLNISTYALFVIWIIGIIHSYKAGKSGNYSEETLNN